MLISVDKKTHAAILKAARQQTAKQNKNVSMGNVVKQLVKFMPELKKAKV